jgi:hypothetical protein
MSAIGNVNWNCPICSAQLEEAINNRVTTVTHSTGRVDRFHPRCIIKAATLYPSCPICPNFCAGWQGAITPQMGLWVLSPAWQKVWRRAAKVQLVMQSVMEFLVIGLMVSPQICAHIAVNMERASKRVWMPLIVTVLNLAEFLLRFGTAGTLTFLLMGSFSGILIWLLMGSLSGAIFPVPIFIFLVYYIISRVISYTLNRALAALGLSVHLPIPRTPTHHHQM